MRQSYQYDAYYSLSNFCLQYIIAYPISRGTMVNFVAFKSQYDLENSKFNGAWVCISEKSELINIFRGWEPEVQALVDVCQKLTKDEKKLLTLTCQLSV